MDPVWKLVANLGDADPVEHGGFFVFVDKSKLHTAQVEFWELVDDAGNGRVFRWDIQRCTFLDGVLSDNPFHPSVPAWFADSIANVADSVGRPADDVIADLCSDDPITRANAYRHIAEVFGALNYDEYPIECTRAELEKRFENLSKLKDLVL